MCTTVHATTLKQLNKIDFIKVTRLSWTAPLTRVLIHVCDVSGHGRRFHARSGLSDPYPEGDPRGQAFAPHALIPRLMRQTGISFYVFMKLTEYTDKMIQEFASIAKSARGALANGGPGKCGGGDGNSREKNKSVIPQCQLN